MIPKKNPFKEVFKEIESALWDHSFMVSEGNAVPYYYDNETFQACLKIFMEAMIWKTYENMGDKDESGMCQICQGMGEELRAFILKYTKIDTHKTYSDEITEINQLPI